jgi:DNA mismatch repair ATPase MutL
LPPDAEKGNDLKAGDESAAKGGEGEKGPGDPDEKGAEQEEGGDSKDGSPQDKQSDKQDSGGEDKGQSDSQGQDQRSMMDKLRDAVNNLMNKVSSDPPQKGKQKAGDKQKGQKQDKGDKSQEKGEKAEGDPQSESDQQGDQGDPKDAKQSNAPGQKTSEDAKSGAGQDDGKKDIENVKALEAMGKMSELLGQRSAAISGELMVEVGTTKQQLKTAMTQQKAGHTDAGGEIHRDQVPLAYQTFVERYFQEVRKTPAAGKAAPKGQAAESSK